MERWSTLPNHLDSLGLCSVILYPWSVFFLATYRSFFSHGTNVGLTPNNQSINRSINHFDVAFHNCFELGPTFLLPCSRRFCLQCFVFFFGGMSGSFDGQENAKTGTKWISKRKGTWWEETGVTLAVNKNQDEKRNTRGEIAPTSKWTREVVGKRSHVGISRRGKKDHFEDQKLW